MPNSIVIYHANCNDGFCAAWLLHSYGGMTDAEYLPAQYGDAPPDVTGRKVFVLDFSYPRDVLLRMKEQSDGILVLDHHKTAAADLAGLDFCRFDMDRSGARLTWEFLNPWLPPEPPWLVDYTEDRDLWRWRLPNSREVNAALGSYPQNFAVWDWVSKERGPERLLLEGEAILRYQNQLVSLATRNAAEVEIGGCRVPCVNATVLQSEIAGALADGKPFGACYFVLPDGRFVYSLRSRSGGMDVSEVAKRYGGGGHRQAAGFTVDRAL